MENRGLCSSIDRDTQAVRLRSYRLERFLFLSMHSTWVTFRHPHRLSTTCILKLTASKAGHAGEPRLGGRAQLRALGHRFYRHGRHGVNVDVAPARQSLLRAAGCTTQQRTAQATPVDVPLRLLIDRRFKTRTLIRNTSSALCGRSPGRAQCGRNKHYPPASLNHAVHPAQGRVRLTQPRVGVRAGGARTCPPPPRPRSRSRRRPPG